MKSNRLDLTLLRNHLDDNFLNNESWDVIDKKFDEVKDLIGDQQKQVDSSIHQMKQGQDSLIAAQCDVEMANKMGKYEKVTEAFSQFFNQEEIGAIIDRKADIELFRRL